MHLFFFGLRFSWQQFQAGMAAQFNTHFPPPDYGSKRVSILGLEFLVTVYAHMCSCFDVNYAELRNFFYTLMYTKIRIILRYA